MKTLLVLFCFVAFCAAAFGQNQTLMVNTNFTVIQTNTNALVFRSPIGFGTNTLFQAQSRTNFGLTSIGDSIVTATNVTNAQNAIGISSSNVLVVSNVDIEFFGAPPADAGFVGPSSSGTLLRLGTNVSTGTPAFYGFDGFARTAMAPGVARTNLGLGGGITATNVFVDLSTNTNTVTISNGIITSWTVAP